MAQGKITLPHICPQCGKKADYLSRVRKKIGFRNMNGIHENQVGCRECRKTNSGPQNLTILG